MYSTILLRKVQENKSIKCSDTNLVFKIFKIWLCTFKVYNSLRVIFHQPKFYVSLIFSFYIIITKAEIYMLQRKKEVFILFLFFVLFVLKMACSIWLTVFIYSMHTQRAIYFSFILYD